MKRYFILTVLVIISSIWLLLAIVPGKSEQVRQAQDVQAAGTYKGILRPDINFGKIPLYFLANQGQVNKKALFYAKASRYTLWLTKEGLVFDSTLKVEEGKQTTEDRRQKTDFKRHLSPGIHAPMQSCDHASVQYHSHSPQSTQSSEYLRDVSRLFFPGANKNPEVVPVEETKLRVNYFKGKDKSQWHCDIPTSKAVLYKNLYKNIDLKIYGIEKEIEYDWIVKPGANPKDIRFEYKNVKGTRLDEEGNLLIETDFGELMHKKPVSYQERKAQNAGVGAGSQTCPQKRKEVNVTFKKIAENTYGFEVGEYDKSRRLIIDPVVLVYSTYLGGNDIEIGNGIAVDGSGCVYVTGHTDSLDFPTRDEYRGYQPGVYSSKDIFVTKLDTTKKGASSLIYSTYLGGNDSDYGNAIAVDGSGCAYVTGRTSSGDFPTRNQYQGDTGVYASNNAFLTKLDTTKNGAASLVYSTHLGGERDEGGAGIAVDDSGCAYVTGATWSPDFPTKNQYQAYQGGYNYDAFIAKLDTTKSGASSLIYSTYLGGERDEGGYEIAVDNSGCAYVTGYTNSSNFPILDEYQSHQGNWDAFITKLDTTKTGASSLIYSTYLGGGNYEGGYGIAVDGSGCAYVTGDTTSMDFPTLDEYQASPPGGDAFITKLDTTKKGTSSLIYSTYLGGWNDDYGFGIAVDGSGCAYVTGYTQSSDFPTLNQYQVNQESTDAFVAKLDTTKKGASSLIYSTYLGGDGSDTGRGIAVDNSGCAYVIGNTYSSDFPTRNQYQALSKGSDVFITRLVLCSETPSLQLNRDSLYFNAVSGGRQTGAQGLLVDISGGCDMPWTTSGDETWIKVTPKSAAGSALATVGVDTAGLDPGTYTGTVFFIYGSASDSITVNLTIYDSAAASVPFGEFSTPLDASIARGSIPVTGWVLDDMEVKSVKIYRDSNIYVGDAVFVDGARPDVEAAFPDYPFNYRAGWGCMLLTNFLPNGGSGTHTIYAIATDVEGSTVTLGAKTIVCDNANAVKPFGTIDTPAQGGTASGPGYINWGWALTPRPNSIPIDGSTIHVWVDGVNMGNPVYNISRPDIAALFPGYSNSSGAAGYFYLDATAFANGLHTIQWTVTDSGGNTDGIGSRYFTILNPGSTKQSSIQDISQNTNRNISSFLRFSMDAPGRRVQEHSFTCVESIPADPGPVLVKTGFDSTAPLQSISPDESDMMNITVPPAGRVEIRLWPESPSDNGYAAGCQVVGNLLRPLPPGSTLDAKKGIFYWQPGPAFMGSYDFLFVSTSSPGAAKKIRIIIM